MRTMSTLNPVSNFLMIQNLLENELKNFFDTEIKTGSLPVNIKETEDRFLIELVAPGFQKNDFSVEVEKNRLTIKAERQEATENQSIKEHVRQFTIKNFTRSFRIPKTVDVENISASYESGILLLNLLKKKEEIIETKKLIDVK